MAKDTFNLNEWVGNKERRLLKEDYEELTPEEMANQNDGSPMHRPQGLEEEEEEIDTGGFIENMNLPVLNAAIDEINGVWEEWKRGPATEPYQIPIAFEALIDYIEDKLDLDIK